MASVVEGQQRNRKNVKAQLQLYLEKLPGYCDTKLAYCIGGLTPLINNNIITTEQALRAATTRFARVERVMYKAIDKRPPHEDPRAIGRKAAAEFMQRRLPREEEAANYLLKRRSRKNLEDQG